MLDVVFVSRHLRAALREWYAWLSDKAMREEDWIAVPHWCKQIPSRLDIPWALHDLQKHAGRKQMIRALFVVVDEIYMASDQMENVPDISRLHGELLRWYGEEYE